MLSSKTKGILSLVMSAFGFALMALFVRLCDDYGPAISSFQKSFFRNFIALLIAAVVFFRQRFGVRGGSSERTESPSEGIPRIRGGAPRGGAFRPLALLLARSLFGSVGIFANFYALSKITIAEGQTLNKTAPFFTVIFAWLFLKERVSLKQFGALLLAFFGVVLIAKPGFAGEHAFPLAMGLMGGLGAGVAYVCVRALRNNGVAPSFIILFFSAFSCLVSIPLMWPYLSPMTFAQILILIGAGAGAAIGQFGVTLAYGFAAPRDIAVYDYTNILFTAVFGFAFFGQMPDLWSLLGFAAIILAAFRLK